MVTSHRIQMNKAAHRPGLPPPLQLSGPHRSADGSRFAFARFKIRDGELEVRLRGEREATNGTDDISKIKADLITINAAISSKTVSEVFFRRYDFASGDDSPINPAAWSPFKIKVDEPFRRRGVAKSIYGMMQACGFPIEPSTALLDEGQTLWRAIDPGACTDRGRNYPPCTD